MPGRPEDRGGCSLAKDFGISEAAVHNWVKRADVADGLAAAAPVSG